MSDDDLLELERLLKEAPPLPWYAPGSGNYAVPLDGNKDYLWTIRTTINGGMDYSSQDLIVGTSLSISAELDGNYEALDLTVAAVNALPKLIAEVRRLREVCAQDSNEE